METATGWNCLFMWHRSSFVIMTVEWYRAFTDENPSLYCIESYFQSSINCSQGEVQCTNYAVIRGTLPNFNENLKCILF